MNCKYCQSSIVYAGTGRILDYCCNAHRQACYRLRKGGYQRQRQSASLKLLVLRNNEQIRNAKLPFLQLSAGTGVFQQVDWTAQ